MWVIIIERFLPENSHFFTTPDVCDLVIPLTQVRSMMAAGCYSDHLLVVQAYERWQETRREGSDGSFVRENFLHRGTLSMMEGELLLNCVQWSLRIVDTLGPAILSFIERLSSLWRLRCTSVIEKGPQIVSSIERFFFYCVLYSECSLSEVLTTIFFSWIVSFSLSLSLSPLRSERTVPETSGRSRSDRV